jgi:hypothetical protein
MSWRVEVEIGPSQIDHLRDLQSVAIHKVQQQLVALSLTSELAGRVDQAPCFI